MKLEKAIKILDEFVKGKRKATGLDFLTAQLLGIEAMIRLQGNRKYPKFSSYRLLPGETED